LRSTYRIRSTAGVPRSTRVLIERMVFVEPPFVRRLIFIATPQP
jgi:hypothetical protein